MLKIFDNRLQLYDLLIQLLREGEDSGLIHLVHGQLVKHCGGTLGQVSQQLNLPVPFHLLVERVDARLAIFDAGVEALEQHLAH